MPSIRLSDNLGLNLEIPVQSSFSKYLRHDLVNLVAIPNLKNDLQQTLGDTTLKPAGIGLEFKHGVDLGPGEAELGIAAGGHARLAIHKSSAHLFGGDLIGDPVTVAEGQAYVGGSLSARLKPGVAREAGHLTFGFESETQVTLESYQRFPAGQTVGKAFTSLLSQFAIPGNLDDLSDLPPHAICCASGVGAMTLSGTVEMATAPNPLAIPGLPAAVPAIAVKPAASLGVSASFTITGSYELRVRKLEDGRVRLGYYKRDQAEFSVAVEARAGVAAGTGSQDWISSLLRAASRDPQAETSELEQAGLKPEHIHEIENGIQSGVERSLAASLQAQIAMLQAGEAAFLYDVDVDGLTSEGRRAVNAALIGDVSLLAAIDDAGSLHGIALRRSVFKETRERGLRLRVNLLGILNFVSISKLMIEGTVVTDPLSGEVTITDAATAKRLRALMLNFGENQAKIRKLFFEAMVATVTYRASKMIESVAVTSTHCYFELHQKTSRQTMKDNLEALAAVGLMDAAGMRARLAAGERFGRSTLLIEAAYSDADCERLFFDEGGKPRQPEYYEAAARHALAMLVTADDPDSKRRVPAVDDALWADMKALGNRDDIVRRLRARLGPDTPFPLLLAIDGDFAFIAAFWSQALHKTAQKLSEVRGLLAENPGIGSHDPRFQKMRKDLAKHLGDLANDTKERFGDPLGLVAMYYAAGRTASVSAKLDCPLFSISFPKAEPARIES